MASEAQPQKQSQKKSESSSSIMPKWIHDMLLIILVIIILYILTIIKDFILVVDKYTTGSLDLKFPTVLKAPIVGIFTIIKYILINILWIIVGFLVIIFIIWEIIKYIVPPIIPVFIGILIILVPIRKIFLEFVPPFKALTDAGVLPFMETAAGILLGGGTLIGMLTSFGTAVTGFLTSSLGYVSSSILPFEPLNDFEKLFTSKSDGGDNNNITIDIDAIASLIDEANKKDGDKSSQIGGGGGGGTPIKLVDMTAFENSITEPINSTFTSTSSYMYNVINNVKLPSLNTNNAYYNNAIKLINNERENCIIGNITEITSNMSPIQKNTINAANIVAINVCNNNANLSIQALNITNI